MSYKNFININHALLELRFGKPVIIKDNNGKLNLVAASEVITDKTISFMKNISGSNPTIIITKERYSLINKVKSKDPQKIYPKLNIRHLLMGRCLIIK